MHIVKKK